MKLSSKYKHTPWDHTSLADLYEHLLLELASFSIYDLDAYHGTRESLDYLPPDQQVRFRAMEFGFTNSCAALLRGLRTSLEVLPGLGVFVPRTKTPLHRSAASKLLVYAHTSLFEAEPIHSNTIEWEIDTAERSLGNEARISLGPDISGPLAMVFQYMPNVRRGLFLPVPTRIDAVGQGDLQAALDDHVENPEKAGDSRRYKPVLGAEPQYTAVPSSEAHFYNLDHSDTDDDYVMDIDPVADLTKHAKLPRNILRLRGEHLGDDVNVLKLGLRLPSIGVLDPVVARQLRDDHQDDFMRFQKALVKFANGIEGEPDLVRFRILVDEVTAEIRQLQDKFSQLQRRFRSLRNLIVLLNVALCVTAASPALAAAIKDVVTAIGGAGVLELFRLRQELKDIEQHPLYFGIRASKAADLRPPGTTGA